MNNRRYEDRNHKPEFDFNRVGNYRGQKDPERYYATEDADYRLAPYETRGGPRFDDSRLSETKIARRPIASGEDDYRYTQSGDYGYRNQMGGDHYSVGREEGFIDRVKNFFGRGPKGYKRSDERIREEVCEILYMHPDIDASEIEVDVKEGIVLLSGTVDSRSTRRLAEDVIERCSGVVDVQNRLKVQPAPSARI